DNPTPQRDLRRGARVLVVTTWPPRSRFPAEPFVVNLTADHAVATRSSQVDAPALLIGRTVRIVLMCVQKPQLPQMRKLGGRFPYLVSPAAQILHIVVGAVQEVVWTVARTVARTCQAGVPADVCGRTRKEILLVQDDRHSTIAERLHVVAGTIIGGIVNEDESVIKSVMLGRLQPGLDRALRVL